MNVSDNIGVLVGNRKMFVPLAFRQSEGIDGRLIGHNAAIVRGDVLLQYWSDFVFCDRTFASVPEAETASALNHAHDSIFLAVLPTISLAYGFAAAIGFIYFYRACQKRSVVFFHRFTDALGQMPCRAVAYFP